MATVAGLRYIPMHTTTFQLAINSIGVRRRSRGRIRPQTLPLVVAICAALTGGNSCAVWADEPDERIQRLEGKLQEVTEELKALRDEVAKRQMGEADKPLAQGTREREHPENSDELARAALEHAIEAKEKAKALEQRLDQQGIQARFNEGILFEDPRGNWSLKVGGRVQLDYRVFSPRQAIADTFSLRRARAGVDATLYKDYRIVVEAEYANGNAAGTTTQNVALTLGYFDIGVFAPGARVRLGQFKPAYGYEQTILDLYSDYMERGFGQSLLQNLNYDRGVMIYGAPTPGLCYGLTYGNGVGQNLEEKQANAQEVDAAKPELTARLTGNFAEFLELRDKIVQLGASHKSGAVANSSASPYTAASAQTEGRGATFFTPSAFNATGASVSNIDRQFSAYEYLFAWGPVKLQGEVFEVQYAGTRVSPAPEVAFKRKLKAEYVTLMWLVTGESYADFFRDSTIAKIRPRNRFSRQAEGGWGALELGVRYSKFDGSEFSNSNPLHTGRLGATSPVTSSTSKAQAMTYQVKWIPNIHTRFSLDYVNTTFDTPIVVNGVTESSESALTLRAQIDF